MPATTCVTTIHGTNKCPNNRKPGSRYCDDHQDRPGAVRERANNTIDDALEDNDIVDVGPSEPTDVIGVPEPSQTTEVAPRTSSAGTTVFDKVLATLDKAQELSSDAYNLYSQRLRLAQSGDPEGIRYVDKAGAEQARTELAFYERAVDREIRVVTAVAKLSIENQALNMNDVLKELIKSVVIAVFRRMEMTPDEIDLARRYLSEEFAKQRQAKK